ncbi:hypothetical protein GCM10011428_55380 [Streptomyces violaceus]
MNVIRVGLNRKDPHGAGARLPTDKARAGRNQFPEARKRSTSMPIPSFQFRPDNTADEDEECLEDEAFPEPSLPQAVSERVAATQMAARVAMRVYFTVFPQVARCCGRPYLYLAPSYRRSFVTSSFCHRSIDLTVRQGVTARSLAWPGLRINQRSNPLSRCCHFSLAHDTAYVGGGEGRISVTVSSLPGATAGRERPPVHGCPGRARGSGQPSTAEHSERVCWHGASGKASRLSPANRARAPPT